MSETPAFDADGLAAAAARFREPAPIVRDGPRGALGVGRPVAGRYDQVGLLPAIYPEWLGERGFTAAHRLRFPYVAGEMANGIATPALVIAMARAGMLGFFGAAGLALARVERGLDDLEHGAGDASWGANLIHSPAEPALENAVAELYLRRGVRRICASAFMALTPAVVRCAATGLARDGDGRVVRRHHLFAKVSRLEVAEAFLAPAPRPLLDALARAGQLTAAEVALAAEVPIADDLTVEADSGGHTDNRPLGALLPAILALRDHQVRRHGFRGDVRVGAAGGLGTPAAVAAAFALGAAYVVTGSVNQAAVEAGLSADGRRMLAEATLADVIMAPAADMFELGVKVQVLRRGTLFGVRALRLHELYRSYDAIEAMPPDVVARLEREILGASYQAVWADVERFFGEREPGELARAARDPKHRMALIFRWYLGMSSRWAIDGEPTRRLDYQIWCGPAMGAFNAWVKGSFLEPPEQRTVAQIALNLLEGAAVVTRAQQLRSAGVAMPASAFAFVPRPLG
jgi:trans-AT polyketide synthase/acyltransferase/oxidoreductase domain-containing protein